MRVVFNTEPLFSSVRGLTATVTGDPVRQSEVANVENRPMPDYIWQYTLMPDKSWPIQIEDCELFPERLLEPAD